MPSWPYYPQYAWIPAIAIVVVITIIVLLIKGIRRAKTTKIVYLTSIENLTEKQEQDEADPGLIEAIGNVSSADELIYIVNSYDEFYGEENKALLKKALKFEKDLSKDDWYDILRASEEGSELERVAEERY